MITFRPLNRAVFSVLLFFLALLVLAGCRSPRPGGQGLQVENIEFLILESFPVQVNAVIQGTLPDECTFITEIHQDSDLAHNRLMVIFETARQEREGCASRPVPFEETIPLEVLGLPAGTYTVEADGTTGEFTLDVDNVPQGPCSYVYPACREMIRVEEAGIIFSVPKDWVQVGPYQWSPDGERVPRIGLRWQEAGADWRPESMLPAGYEILEQQTPELSWGEGEFYFISVDEGASYELHVIARGGAVGYDFYAVGSNEQEMAAVEETHYLVTSAAKRIE